MCGRWYNALRPHMAERFATLNEDDDPRASVGCLLGRLLTRVYAIGHLRMTISIAHGRAQSATQQYCGGSVSGCEPKGLLRSAEVASPIGLRDAPS